MMQYLQLSGVASVIITAVSLLMAARLLRTIIGSQDVGQALLSYAGWVLLALGSLGACLLIGGGIGFLAWPIVIGIWIRTAINRRAAQRRNLLSALTLAVSKQMPLAPVATAFAAEEDGGFARLATRVADWLKAGVSLRDIIGGMPQCFPREAPLAAQLGEQSGDLAGALAATSAGTAIDTGWLRPIITRLFYLLPATLVFIAFMKLKIEPSLFRIFYDFDLEMPALSRMAMGSRDFLPDYAGTAGESASGSFYGLAAGLFVDVVRAWMDWAAWGCLALAVLLLILSLVAWLEWRGTLRARLPGWKRILRWVDMSTVLRVLQFAVEHQMSVTGALDAMVKAHPKASVRGQLRGVLQDVNNGQRWEKSFSRRRLLSAAEVSVLSSAETAGNLPWALGEMAASFERRASYRLQAWSQVLTPLLFLPFGLYVGTLAVAYMAPLAALIETLSQ